MWPRILVLTLFLIGTSQVFADHCSRVRTVYSTYVAPTSYVAPTYKENIILVPKAIEVEVARPHYYSIDSYYQQSLLADAIVGRLLQAQSKGTINNGVARPTNGTAPVPTSPVAPMPPAGAVLGLSSYQNPDLSLVLKNSCVKCHDGKTRSAFLSTDDKLLDLPRGNVSEIYRQVNTGRMPKGASPLEDKYMALIDAWVEASK